MNKTTDKQQKIPETNPLNLLISTKRLNEKTNPFHVQQINNLHQEFEDLKKKIIEVEDKNEKIIKKIYKNYNFKKKNSVNTQSCQQVDDQSPIIYYENKKYTDSFHSNEKDSGRKNKSNYLQKQKIKINHSFTKQQQKIVPKQQNNQKFNYIQQQYGKIGENLAMQQLEKTKQPQKNQKGNFAHQYPPFYPQFNLSQAVSQKKLVQQLNQQKQLLEEQISQKCSQIRKLQYEMKNYKKNLKGIMESQLSDFYEKSCHKNMQLVEKALKKYEQRLKNIKRSVLILKDRQQDKKSSRLLQYGRQRRSQPRIPLPFKGTPPRPLSKDSRDDSQTQQKIGRSVEKEKKKKKFQEIVNRYESLIKQKNQEIERNEHRYRLKERQCYELQVKVDMVQQKLIQEEKKNSKSQQSHCGDNSILKMGRRFQTEQNLLFQTDYDVQNSQMIKLKSKIQQLNLIIDEKSSQVSSLQTLLSIAENKNKMLYHEYESFIHKEKDKYKQYEKQTQQKNEEIVKYKNSLILAEKKYLEKQWECYSFQEKLKKMQEFGKNINHNTSTADKKIGVDQVVLEKNNQNEVQKLKKQIENFKNKLENDQKEICQLNQQRDLYRSKCEQLERVNLQLKKQIKVLQIEIEQHNVKININDLELSAFPMKNKEYHKIENNASQYLSKIGQNPKQVLSDHEQLSPGQQQQFNNQENLANELQPAVIKIQQQQLNYQENYPNQYQLISTLQEENQSLKIQHKQLINKLYNLQLQLQTQREEFKIQLIDIQKKWIEFEENTNKNDKLNKIEVVSFEKSEKSDVVNYKRRSKSKSKVHHDQLEHSYPIRRYKSVQSSVNQLEKGEQQKIATEQQINFQQFKIDIKNKNQQIDLLKSEISNLNKQIIKLSTKLQNINKNERSLNYNNKQYKNQFIERVEELQNQLKSTKQVNNKLTQMENQLFKQIKTKQEEMNELYKELKKKQEKIQKLQETIDGKTNMENEQQDNINNAPYSTNKKETIQSQSSLKYSSTHTPMVRKNRLVNSDKLFNFELSYAESLVQQLNQIQNMTQLFQKQQISYERERIKRQQRIKLFEKMTSYINQLKKTIDDKNKKIKLLEKKIQSLKQSELVRKQLGFDIQMKEDRITTNNLQADEIYRDYESVQLQYKRSNSQKKYKKLQHDTRLLMEENNLLIQQIENLEFELLKAEEQQNNLVKIKDLYKEEIKKLINKNDEQTKEFQLNVSKEKKKIQENQGVHNLQAIKQLYLKIIQIAFLLTEENIVGIKKKEKRKQLQEHVKIMGNILKLDKKNKDPTQTCLHK